MEPSQVLCRQSRTLTGSLEAPGVLVLKVPKVLYDVLSEVCSIWSSQVIVMGAEQNGLPKDYQEKLKSIDTNRYQGQLSVMTDLEVALPKARERGSHRSDA